MSRTSGITGTTTKCLKEGTAKAVPLFSLPKIKQKNSFVYSLRPWMAALALTEALTLSLSLTLPFTLAEDFIKHNFSVF